MLTTWTQAYHQKTCVTVHYQGIGSGGGIALITAKTVDFGDSDKPLRRADLAAKGLVQFPLIGISIVPVVNLPGIAPGQLVLDGATLADIYLGKITNWNDPAIKALNPKLKLPDLAITVAHRSDGSGTTLVFTDYLRKVSPEWAAKVGSDTFVNWPVGIGGKGCCGIWGELHQIPGAIGYGEFAYAQMNHVTYADMMDASGKRMSPGLASFQAALAKADFSGDFDLVPTNQPDGWPIMAVTYILMRPAGDADRNKAVLGFLDYALHDGVADSEKLGYVPLPPNVVRKVEDSWQTTLGVRLP